VGDRTNDYDSTWHGLDEGPVRLYIRDLVKGMELHATDSYSKFVRQLTKLHVVVQEETAAALRLNVNLKIEYADKTTFATCKKLAEDISRDLAGLGLAMHYSKAGPEAVRLAVSSVPPGASQSWLQLEPIDPTSRQRTYRLPSAFMDKLDLVVAPIPKLRASKESGRAT
jgi:hypothetical protein